MLSFFDFSSAYPSMDVAHNEDFDWFFNGAGFYKVPYGIIRHHLNKAQILYKETIKKQGNIVVEKIIDCELGRFHFSRGGKNKSWLCHKFYC